MHWNNLFWYTWSHIQFLPAGYLLLQFFVPLVYIFQCMLSLVLKVHVLNVFKWEEKHPWSIIKLKLEKYNLYVVPYLVVRVDISFVIMVREEGKVEMRYSRAHPSSSSVGTGWQQPGPAADRSSLSLAEVKNV
jgi:hypothetical protein